jgi:hypothetical protein
MTAHRAPESKKRKIGFLVEEKAAAYGRRSSALILTFREFSKRGSVLWFLNCFEWALFV